MPDIRYAKSGEFHIAYQVTGDGPFDLVFAPSWFSNLEIWWEEPGIARVFTRLASFCRLILFDRRGTGLSDRVGIGSTASLDDRVEDHIAVMDAAGCERAAILASSVSGQLGLYVAATHPGRTTALVLHNSSARMRRAEDYPAGAPDYIVDRYIEDTAAGWATGLLPTNPATAGGFPARFQRQAMAPGAAVEAIRLNQNSDLRSVLSAVRVPTLVLHGADSQLIRAGHGRYLAANIPGARYVELAGASDLFSDPDPVLDETQEFLTGSRERLDTDVLLATVLFTDIAESTARTAAGGDHRWRELLDEHDVAVRRELARFGGREVKTTGDGFLATFDGAVRAIQCAHAIVKRASALGVDLRAGLHTGECEVRGSDVTGMAVNIAARVQTAAAPGEVLVSQTVKDLVIGSTVKFTERRSHILKGVPGEWRLFAVAALA